MDLNINVEEHFNQSNSKTTNPDPEPVSNNNKIKSEPVMENFDISSYGLPLEDVYNLARNFLKGKNLNIFLSKFSDYFFFFRKRG